MNEIVDAVNSRIKSPYFGYAFLAFIALNWRGFFLLFALQDTPQARLQAFDDATSTMSLLAWPFVVAALISLASPWIKLIFNLLSQIPFEKLESIDLEAEHKKAILRTKYEKTRAELFAIKEQELIDRAKRDKAVEEIDDVETKERLWDAIEQLRAEQAKLGDNIPNSETDELSHAASAILEAAVTGRSGKISIREGLSGRSVQVGNIVFGKEDDRGFIEYSDALDELIGKKLARRKSKSQNGSVSELTHKGWTLAEELIEKQNFS